MGKFRDDVCIVMRTFWPVSPVVGEGMMQVAERLAETVKCSVIMQDHSGIRRALDINHRGQGVSFCPIKAFSNSSSGIFLAATLLQIE